MFLTWSLVLHRSCQLLEMRWQLYRTNQARNQGGRSPLKKFPPPLEKSVGHSLNNLKKKTPEFAGSDMKYCYYIT